MIHSKFQTDLNSRERARFAKQLRDLAEHAEKGANALIAGRDDDFIMNFLLVTLTASSLKEINDYLQTQLKNQRAAPFSDFPETIDGL